MNRESDPKTVLPLWLKTVFLCSCLFLSACQSTQKLPPTAINLTKITDLHQKKADKDNRNQFKYLSETAVLLFYQGQFQQAERYFEKAQLIEDDSYTRSTTELILSKIVNENAKQFRAHYLARWQLRYLAALNFLAQQNVQSALVELRRLSRSCRIKKDPFEEKIIDQARNDYLLHTGVLMCLLGREEEGKVDLRYLEKNNYEFPDFLIKQAWFWNYEKSTEEPRESSLSLFPQNEKQKLRINFSLKGHGPTKKEQRLSITMLGVLPLIQAYMDGKDGASLNQVNDIATGVLGKRLIEIAYPVMNSVTSYTTNIRSLDLDFGQLYHKSWDAQKNRLIAQSALRIISKVYASYQIEHAIEKNVEGPWGQLLGNIGRLALWKTEQADLRQILFLPSLIGLDWSWEEKQKKDVQVFIKRDDLF